MSFEDSAVPDAASEMETWNSVKESKTGNDIETVVKRWLKERNAVSFGLGTENLTPPWYSVSFLRGTV
jgi:hypothetical protein